MHRNCSGPGVGRDHLHVLVPLVAAVANLVVCVPVLRRRSRRPVHWAFAWMTLTIAAWNLGIFSLWHFRDPADAEWWSRLFRIGTCFAPVAVFHVALEQAGSSGRGWRAALAAGYLAAAILAAANLAGLLVRGVSPHPWGWYVEPAPLYAGVTILVLLYLALAAERVWHAFRHPATPRQRTQAKFWFLATAVQVPFVLTNLLPIYGVEVYPLGNLGNVTYTTILAYAIARHRLLDADHVAQKLVSFSLAAGVVLLPGGLAIAVLAQATGAEAPLVVTSAALGLAATALLTVPRLRAGIETRLLRALAPARYDHRLRLRQLAAALLRILDRSALLATLRTELQEILRLERCEIVARDEETARWRAAHAAPDAGALPVEIVACIERLPEPALVEELETAAPAAAAACRERGWEAVMPLRCGASVTAFVGLGRNTEFRLLSAEDLGMLTSVAASAGVALENASLSRQLRRSELALERSSRLSSLGMLTAGIAHEIRNPLCAVKTFLELLPARIEERDFVSSFRDMSLSELRRVTDLVSDMLALGKSGATRLCPVDLAATLQPVLRLMQSTAHKRQVEVRVDAPAELPRVLANPDQLKQIALNLLLNAIEASPPEATVTVSLRAVGRRDVELEVRDEGPGMPPETRAHVFDPFYTTKETGTGLGLALVHQMVAAHRGEITVDGADGHGTVFRVTLPAVPLESEPSGQAA